MLQNILSLLHKPRNAYKNTYTHKLVVAVILNIIITTTSCYNTQYSGENSYLLLISAGCCCHNSFQRLMQLAIKLYKCLLWCFHRHWAMWQETREVVAHILQLTVAQSIFAGCTCCCKMFLLAFMLSSLIMMTALELLPVGQWRFVASNRMTTYIYRDKCF